MNRFSSPVSWHRPSQGSRSVWSPCNWSTPLQAPFFYSINLKWCKAPFSRSTRFHPDLGGEQSYILQAIIHTATSRLNRLNSKQYFDMVTHHSYLRHRKTFTDTVRDTPSFTLLLPVLYRTGTYQMQWLDWSDLFIRLRKIRKIKLER